MRNRLSLSILVITLGAVSPRQALAHEPNELVSRIVSTWRTRQVEVRSLSCRAQVDTFYPKGSLSTELRAEAQGQRPVPDYPAADQWFRNETAAWTIDFVGKRVRKELAVTNPFYTSDSCDLRPDCQVHLYANGKYRLFRPRGRNPWMREDNKRQSPDVFLYEDRSINFLFEFIDLPLFWSVGGVTGKQVVPDDMKRLEVVDRFSYRGEAEKNGVRCVVLTTQEQDATTIVREFWVDVRPPYLIRFCRAREGDLTLWQSEADYQDGEWFPSSWTHTQYLPPDAKAFTTRTFRVQHVSVNQSIPNGTFDNTLEEGMVAFDVARNDVYVADRDGLLTLYREESFRPDRWWRSGLGVTAALLGLVLLALWRWQYRRQQVA